MSPSNNLSDLQIGKERKRPNKISFMFQLSGKDTHLEDTICLQRIDADALVLARAENFSPVGWVDGIRPDGFVSTGDC